MAKFKIFSKDGRTVRYEGKPRYNGIFGSPSYVEFSEISSPRPISFEIGDYVDYSRTGFRYRLYNIPAVEKSARMDEYGNGFIYKNVQFYCATKDLEIALFRDVVFNDNTIHFSSIPNVDTYENVYGIAYRIQANIDAFYGSGVWNIKVLSTSDDELNELLYSVKQFSLSDGTCLDALNNIYKLWTGISWVYTVENGVNTITLGKPNVQTGDNTTDIFSYGKGNGLKVIARAVSSKSEMATRIYAYGSDRNMPTRYYNGLNIKDAESVYIPHLMLPLSDWGMTDNLWDASKAYVENTIASAKYGLIPKILRFDGSNDLDDIYPSIEGITIRQMAETGYPTTGYNLNERIDEIKSASNPADDGRYTEDSVKVMKRDVTSFNPYTDSRVAQPGQTYCTLGVDRPIIGGDSNLTSIYVSPGKFNIEFGGIEGYISGINGFTRGFPKITLDVKIDDEIIYTKHLNSYVDGTSLRFTIPDISFNNELYSGSLKVYVRVEIDLVYNTREGCYPSLYIAAGEVTTTIEYLISSTFTVDLKQIGFDLNEMGTDLSDGLCTISFKTGMCAGRDFVVKKCEYDSYANCWHLTCARQEDTALSQYFPNNVYTVNSGDRFVITDMQMPSLYVSAAMDRLHNAAIKALQSMCKPKMVYTPNVDSKAVYESEIVLIEGLYMPVQDIDLIDTVLPSTPHTEWVLIDNVTIAENDDAIPIWSVTLKDEKTENIIQKLTGEITRGNKFINAIREEGTRRPVVDKDNDSDSILAPKVYIDASADMFVYSDTGKLLNSELIMLTAVTEGINNPMFEWFYLGEEDWVALEDGSEQSYGVNANSEEYYQNGELVEDFKVIVTDFNGSFTPGPNSKPMGDTYEAEIRIAKVKSGDGLMVSLNNPSHIFPATDTHAIMSSDTVSVLAYRGFTPIDFELGEITGAPEGMSTSVDSNKNITINVSEALVTPSGTLNIPVIISDKKQTTTETEEEGSDEEGGEEMPKSITVNLTYSWALALRGVPGGKGDKGDDGDDGDDGYSTATVYLYMSSSSDSYPGNHMPRPLTYDFVNGTLSPSSNLNGWSTTIPTKGAFEHVYVIMANVRSNTGTAEIATSDWSSPVRFTGDNGENGLMGKIMRGINEYGEDVPTGVYQGMNGDGMFYDMVFVTDSNGNKTFYYLKDENHQGTPGTDAGSGWVAATYFDFVATKVLLADNAAIDVMSGNAVYMKDGDDLIAGMQGGSTTIYGGSVVDQVNFFAGSSTPQEAPFRVYSDGSFYASDAYIEGEINATSGKIGDWDITSDGIEKHTSGTSYGQHYGLDSAILNEKIQLYDYHGSNHTGFFADLNPDSGDGVMRVEYREGNTSSQFDACVGGDAFIAHGDASIYGDLTINGTLSVSSLEVDGEDFDPSDFVRSTDVKYIVRCSQAYYDSITPEDDVMYVIDD